MNLSNKKGRFNITHPLSSSQFFSIPYHYGILTFFGRIRNTFVPFTKMARIETNHPGPTMNAFK